VPNRDGPFSVSSGPDHQTHCPVTYISFAYTGFCSGLSVTRLLLLCYFILSYRITTVSPRFVMVAQSFRSRPHTSVRNKIDLMMMGFFLGTRVINVVDPPSPPQAGSNENTGQRRSSVDVDTMRIVGVLSKWKRCLTRGVNER
jgi:hypothetical protein